jgi:hypothetical protein
MLGSCLVPGTLTVLMIHCAQQQVPILPALLFLIIGGGCVGAVHRIPRESSSSEPRAVRTVSLVPRLDVLVQLRADDEPTARLDAASFGLLFLPVMAVGAVLVGCRLFR